MQHCRIGVGLDGSAAARRALAWAVRAARDRGATLVAAATAGRGGTPRTVCPVPAVDRVPVVRRPATVA